MHYLLHLLLFKKNIYIMLVSILVGIKFTANEEKNSKLINKFLK